MYVNIKYYIYYIYKTSVGFSELTSLNGTILMCVCLSVYVLYVCIQLYKLISTEYLTAK